MFKCKYCKKPLEEEQDIQNEYHASCHVQMLQYQKDQTSYVKRLHFLTQLKEHLSEKGLEDKNDLDSQYIFVNHFDTYFKYLINFDIYFYRILMELNVFSKDDEVYLNGGELIITYKTSTLEIPELFEHLPSLKLLVIYLYVKEGVEIKNTISEDLMSKCLIKVVVATLFKPSKLNDLQINSLKFELNDLYDELNATVPESLILELNIEEKLKSEYRYLSPEDVAYSNESFGKAILYFNDILATAPLSQVEYIESAVDVTDYSILTKLPNLRYFRAFNFFKIDSIFTLKNLVYLEIHSRQYADNSLENDLIGFYSLKFLRLTGFNFKNFPNPIRNLKNLQILELNACDIEEIPEWLVELKELEILSLINNRLNSFPFEILDQMKILRFLELRGNWNQLELKKMKIDVDKYPHVIIKV